MTCFFFSSFKTLLTSTQSKPCVRVNVLTTLSLAGFQVTTISRFWVTAEVGLHPLLNAKQTTACQANRRAPRQDRHNISMREPGASPLISQTVATRLEGEGFWSMDRTGGPVFRKSGKEWSIWPCRGGHCAPGKIMYGC